MAATAKGVRRLMQQDCSVANLRWGIMSTGHIARAFVADLAHAPGHSVVAVGSRTKPTAERFALSEGIATPYGSYEGLVAAADVDVVYVASPQNRHRDDALLAISAGKHVLLEKPFTMNAEQAREVCSAATAAGVFVMEAMWTRFLPHIVALRTWLSAGELGELGTVVADHGQYFTPDPTFRLFDPERGGGALLDLGVYPVSFAHLILGTPSSVTARSELSELGVDLTTSAVLTYPDAAHAVLTTTLAAATPTTASISGSLARVELDSRFYAPTTMTLIRRNGTRERYDTAPGPGRGLYHQALHLGSCLEQGLGQSPLMPHADTIAVMRTLDEIRAQVGLRFPGLAQVTGKAAVECAVAVVAKS